ncbi:MAG: sensor histidine kinase [Polyangiaceae bacterium]
MKRAGGLATRMVVATVLCGIIGFTSSRFVWRQVTYAALLRFHRPLADYTWDTYERARCQASPETWSIRLERGARSYAYDSTTLTSRNPDAPPLDRGLWESLSRGTERVAIGAHGSNLASGGALVHRTGDDGPCAIVQTTWPAQPIEGDFLTWIPVGFLFTATAAAGIGLFALARPVVRIEKRRLELQRHLADVAHDLKTPISSLHIALEQAIDANRDAAVAPLLSSALDDSVYLAALTSNLRLASEMREGWDPSAAGANVDLTEIVDRVVSRARFFARRKGIDLEVAVPDAPTTAGCDPVAAEQAISNVVENSVTHGESGEHVAVLLERRGEGFTLTVVDDGHGVPASSLPHLGERTFRSDEARQRDPRGSGLGLAITSEVCRRCGWALSFDREEPRGLRVTIRGACR